MGDHRSGERDLTDQPKSSRCAKRIADRLEPAAPPFFRRILRFLEGPAAYEQRQGVVFLHHVLWQCGDWPSGGNLVRSSGVQTNSDGCVKR